MQFEGKVVVITGGAHGIGKATREAFEAEGALVEVIDIAESAGGGAGSHCVGDDEAVVGSEGSHCVGDIEAEGCSEGSHNVGENEVAGGCTSSHYVGDIAKKEVLEAFAGHVLEKHGRVDYLINNALPIMKGIDDCAYEDFEYAMAVGVTAPFYLSKLFKDYFAEGACIINMSSSRDRMSQPQTESYTAAKGGIASLTHALAVSLARKVRVNSISPGWIDTIDEQCEAEDEAQQLVGRVGKPDDIANMILFLCSDKAGFITGENICIDGGMTRQMIYHGEHGWSYEI